MQIVTLSKMQASAAVIVVALPKNDLT
jgi:hypothetical protein